MYLLQINLHKNNYCDIMLLDGDTMFIGRTEEIKEIKEALDSLSFESIILFGRRRVGKTEIIKESIRDNKLPIVNYECKRTSSNYNLEMLTKVLVETLGYGPLKFDSFDSFFDFVFKESIIKEYILIIDEFSFLLEEDFSIESSLAIAIDKYKNESKLKLIISGSYVNMMTKMIEYGSHSYGRFNHILSIRPFDYYLSSFFYPNYSNEDKIKMFSVFGGVPYFNSFINPNKSADENIINLLVKKDSILEHEIVEMIFAETNKINLLNDLIGIIGSGTTKYKDIVSKLNQYNGSRPDYLLNKLIDMNIIRKVTPINDKNNNKKMYYQFEDNLIHFYYKYIFNNPFSINRTDSKFFYQKFIKDDFEKEYIPKKFERISMDYLLKCNFNGILKETIMDIGTYSFDDSKNKINREFDVVTKDSKGYISYECKYTNSPITNKIIEEEIRQTQNLDIHFYKLGFISKSGFAADVDKEKYNCFNLSDFYK